MRKSNYEVIIIGGSFAGLSAAMALGRSLRDVLIIDAGEPCNRQTPHSHNFLTQDGKTPKEISELSKEQVAAYQTVNFYDGLVTSAHKTSDGFEVSTKSGDQFFSSKMVLATGVKDQMPSIPGFAECWGISVVHCPYCHGYEIRNKKTALFGAESKTLHLAPMLHNLTKDLTLITSNPTHIDEEHSQLLARNNISVIKKEIAELSHENGQLKSIEFTDGSQEEFEAAYAAIPFSQHHDLGEQLGCNFTDTGLIEVDFTNKTNVPGLFACGDNSLMMRSVAASVFAGNVAGAVVNAELSNEAFRA
ncbi:NAD(P)/FAD-dependent oxidoreductase [Jiulongibacter sp. NS-SX5]|uniref:NAD(P)/FAD-dependent oxidoreductase n=1 Tax=Jiulongibacter sp. NS-SX5 TaxID=3463854 RepID=UPI004058099B